VSRLIDSGETVEYDAIYHSDSDGRAIFERVRVAYSFRLTEARALFLSAEDLPIPYFPDWFKISNHFSVINRHTEGRTYTAMAMEQMAVQHLYTS
jgi:hypothetical protein